jgi:hypothetical protein
MTPKNYLMTRKIVFIIALGFLIFSCKKEDNVGTTERGTLIEKTLLYTNTKADFELLKVAFQLPDTIDILVNYDLDSWKIKYYTIDPKGKSTIASGLLIVPKNAETPLPLLSYQHGTILRKSDAPSGRQGGFQVGLLFATEGYVVAVPDYLGIGDGEGLHPYVHAASEATAVIDMMRASRKACEELSVALNSQVFIMGYSQGGHATMAAQKMIEESYADEFKLVASAPMAGPYDLSGVQFDMVMKDTAYSSPGYLPYLIFAYNPIYNLFVSPDEYFDGKYVNILLNYFNDNPQYDLDAVNKVIPAIPNQIFTTEVKNALKTNAEHPLRKALKENNLYDWKPSTPLRLCHCDGDKDVSYQNSVIAYNSFINKGSKDVMLINPLPGGDHSTCAFPAVFYTLKWFRTIKK